MSFREIPVVDLREGRRTGARWSTELTRIGHEVGFFVVTGHDVGPDLERSMFDLAARLFALPEADKRTIDKRKSRHFRGWEPVGSELTHGRTDFREQWDLWTERPARPPDVDPPYLRLLGPNQWPDERILPGARALVTAWLDALSQLADELLGHLAVGLGLERNEIRSAFGEETMSLLKLIRYPPTPEGGAGVNAHHDTGFLTLLATRSPGLEAQSPDGCWVPVPVVEGGFVVNLGEILQAMTQNYLVATPHRVVTGGERISMGYFHGPSLDAELRPLDLGPAYHQAVAESPWHAEAGFMARREEIAAGVADMASRHRPAAYGEQLWNYFVRSYPEIVRLHYPDVAV